jgi:hypothetical protein
MKGKVIEAAGKTWQILGEKDEVKISDLAKLVKEKGEVVFQALGWLAREDKINYISRDGKDFVALVDFERNYYRNIFRPSLTAAKKTSAKKTSKSKS